MWFDWQGVKVTADAFPLLTDEVYQLYPLLLTAEDPRPLPPLSSVLRRKGQVRTAIPSFRAGVLIKSLTGTLCCSAGGASIVLRHGQQLCQLGRQVDRRVERCPS